jgi:hypothetical protein
MNHPNALPPRFTAATLRSGTAAGIIWNAQADAGKKPIRRKSNERLLCLCEAARQANLPREIPAGRRKKHFAAPPPPGLHRARECGFIIQENAGKEFAVTKALVLAASTARKSGGGWDTRRAA